MFDQMHFHWGSEHTIDGRRFALELHMVHHDRRYSLQEALKVKNGIAVLGILFHVSRHANDRLQNILNSVDDIADTVGAEAVIKKPLHAGDLLPSRRSSYFRYEGSLTTPGCMEAVVWTVFTQSIALSLDQLEALKLVKSSSGAELLHNYRQIQPLNSRALIYANDKEMAESSDFVNAAHALSLSSFGVLLLVFLVI